jgi:hypothetical protein
MRCTFAALDFESVQHPWLWLVLAVAAVAALVLTYRGIFRRSERRLTWLLMALRGAGLAALLFALARPTWTRENETVEPSRLAVVLDNSLSMSLADPSGRPRYALAREMIERLKRRLENRDTGRRLAVDLFDINGASLDNLPEQPTVERTDLARAVREATARLRSRPLAGIVLVSDGMDNTGRQQTLGEQDFPELAGLSVPIHAVGFRPDSGAALDLAVRKPEAPERAMVNNEIKVRVPVSKKGGPKTEATVSIKRGRDVFVSQKVSFPAGNDEQEVVLTMTPREAGSFVYTAAVEAGSGERFLGNNFAHFPLRVDKEKIEVLYLEGFLRYEYKFLKRHLEDDPDVNLTSEVRRLNPELGEPAGARRLTPERLKKTHVVILGDMEAAFLSGAEQQALVRWLEEKGHHALLLLGGYRSFGPDGFRATPLADVLPVVFAREPPFQSEDPFSLSLTEKGRESPIFQVSGDRVKDAATWSAAPPLLGQGLVLRAKPGAEVLAENPNPAARVDGKPAVVVATQRYGDGRTMVLTADTTWRWSRLPRIHGQADTLYSRFWSQTIRWLAGRQQDDKQALLVVSTDKPDYAAGKPVTVRVRRQPRPDLPLDTAEVAVEVTKTDGRTAAVQMRATSADPDLFTGTYYPTAGGQYQVAAALKNASGLLANQASEFLVQGSDLELADTGTNRAVLQSLAAATGGSYFDIEDADQLAERITGKKRRTVRVQRTEFWDSPGLFVFFLAAVTTEWVVRRRNHLV